jgi:hypothetical protein
MKEKCLPFVMKPWYHQNCNNKTTKVSLLENHLTEMPSIHVEQSRTWLTMLFITRESVSARLGLPDVFQTLYSLGNPTERAG